MKAVRNTERGVEVVDVDRPAAGPGQVEVTVRSSGLCGSDLHLIGYGPSPFTLGHEFAGTLADGTPVAVDPSRPCGRCDLCTSGRAHLCRDALVVGVSTDGGMAERVVCDPSALVRLPAGLGPDQACLVEPVAVSVHGLAVAGITGGERVAVVGAGSIGLTAVAVAADQGCETALEARHPHQIVAGERLGASGPPSGEYDVVIEAAGSQSAVERAFDLVRPGGQVLFLSTFWDPITLPGVAALMKEVTCRWAYTYGHRHGTRDIDGAAALLARHPEIAATLITHRFPLADAPAAFAVAADRRGGAIKIALEPT